MSIIYLNSSPKAIVCLVQKALITFRTKQKITPDQSLQNIWKLATG